MLYTRSAADNMTERILRNESDTRAFGLELAEKLQPGDVIALVGDLGTGKTALTRYIAEGLGVTETISSPTFTIVKEYSSGRIPLFHFDVYRLSDGGELLDIGADEYLNGNGACIIEWADIVADVLPDDAIVIQLLYGENEGERIAVIG
ncbi:MAG: tRNA (adenosine(37)-N6)-threonylcarbamoyltransferase complex ATPase subunit type 1 TsaE [Mogibacterium sp.]|nr:tRNA (adenosine(37)-N6)-threonylcarbamoyltransferase complex ATPase subunit type 1 TsaE [Mogibacterium sp.]